MQPTEYEYPNATRRWNDDYVWNAVARELVRVTPPSRRVFELGCGNGVSAARMKALGFDVTAVDPSTGGVAAASAADPSIAFAVGGVDDPLGERFGRFPVVVSIEVIEHCYSPKRFAECVLELLEPGGHLILTTPYHGYLKNLTLALAGKMDSHFGALWEGGHIKFFSRKTVRELLVNAGFEVLRIDRVGRVAPLAKSMVVTARRPRR
jgi:2-polyprenyl-6-hydroxyphenyl methylase/3-demethylubiquinone-9 3-methyltransferase